MIYFNPGVGLSNKNEICLLMNDKYIKRIEVLYKEMEIKAKDYRNNHEKMVQTYRTIEEEIVNYLKFKSIINL